ncbi:SDR family NAD(P)-dependent oxidoreductase [Lacisediminimonas profundi]|uniref:SDR family NAD(P)-dependent oxidoreductase n=1 Tax=Lacisediminimonas profundi TaxID=2603856 RepID=UPI00124AE74E|nr:SDR family NAD(P)-dependent oxidoreductase [Lacisediminimonas profundi]
MECSLAGRRALVTGAGSGIGRAIAMELAASGADVCVLDLDEAGLQETVVAIEKLGRLVVPLRHDTGCDSVIGAVRKVELTPGFGNIDLLVNNAGISPKVGGRKRMCWETPPDEWRKVVDVNLNGYFYLMSAVLPGMIERRKGAIVNISSMAAHRFSIVAGVHYCASKSAVVGLTRQVAGEVAPYGIRVNCISPGRIETGMAAEVGAAMNEEIRQATPIGRLGIPDDIAQTACFLLSENAGFITGQTLAVAGGRGL